MSNMRWTAKLRSIERGFNGGAPQPSVAAQRVLRAVERRSRETRDERVKVFGTWARVALVAALGGAILLWPYEHACGVGLLGYTAAQSLIAVGGVWAAISAWRTRMGFAHTVALGLLLWGLCLVSTQVVPRAGLLGSRTTSAAAWRCRAAR
jgi:hypothetical protein